MGIDACSAEEFWLKYGRDEILPLEHLVRFFFLLKHTPPHRCAHLLSRATGCSKEAWWASVHRVHSYLNDVVAEIEWAERLSEWNHVPHFPYFVTHYVASMPIASIGGILCMSRSIPNTPGVYIKLRVPLIVLVTSFGFVHWPPGHRRMFSFGIAKGRKGARGITWIMRLAPWMVHTRGATMWHGHLSVERR